MLLILIPYFHNWMSLVGDGGVRLKFPIPTISLMTAFSFVRWFYTPNTVHTFPSTVMGSMFRSPSCTRQRKGGFEMFHVCFVVHGLHLVRLVQVERIHARHSRK
jgi:hypothetical protein